MKVKVIVAIVSLLILSFSCSPQVSIPETPIAQPEIPIAQESGNSTSMESMLVFYTKEDGRWLFSFSVDSRIIDNGNTWDVYYTGIRSKVPGIDKTTVTYGYYEYYPLEMFMWDDYAHPQDVYMDAHNLTPIERPLTAEEEIALLKIKIASLEDRVAALEELLE